MENPIVIGESCDLCGLSHMAIFREKRTQLKHFKLQWICLRLSKDSYSSSLIILEVGGTKIHSKFRNCFGKKALFYS